MSHALAKRTDPITSHLAARAITESGAADGMRRRVVALVAQNPGRTADELADLMGEPHRFRVARRLSDAKNAGQLKQGDPRDGRVTWWPRERQGALGL